MWPANDKVYNDCGRVLVQPLVPLRRFDKYPAATAALAVAGDINTETRFQFLVWTRQAAWSYNIIASLFLTCSNILYSKNEEQDFCTEL